MKLFADGWKLLDRDQHQAVWIAADILLYALQILFNKRITLYETAILASLDLFLLVAKDERDKLRIFHSLPKLFLLHIDNNIVMQLLVLFLFAIHFIQNKQHTNSIVFFTAVTLSVLLASFGTSKILSASFVVGVMTAYIYNWESVEPASDKGFDDQDYDSKTQEDILLHDHAIAQDLVSKLKRLKVAMIYDNERHKKVHFLTRVKQGIARKAPRSRSAAEKDSRDNSEMEVSERLPPMEEDIVTKNRLKLDEVAQLIEILVSQSNQQTKYWLPKDILSVLNNEEVSAYLWAYLNTQDMLPESSHPRKIRQLTTDSISSIPTTSALGVDFNFDLWAFDKSNLYSDSLVIGCSQIYAKFNMFESMGNLNEATMVNFLTSVQSYYFNNYYHNAIHGIDVTNSCAFFLNTGFKKMFSNFECVTLLISATVHDVGHPGFNNAFMVAVGTNQALIYNDQSVLENYHCSLTFQIIQKEKSNILRSVSREDRIAFRKLLINNVLATDMSKHFPIVKKFESAIDAGLNLNDEQNRHMAMAVALKCADVGHSAKALEFHKIWSRRVTEEFWNQGDHEAKLRIPVTQLCDRKLNIAKSQDGFLGFMAIPLFEGFGKFLLKCVSPECYDKYHQVCIQQLKKNKEYWQTQIEKGEHGNKEFMLETDANLKNFKHANLPLESLLNITDK